MGKGGGNEDVKWVGTWVIKVKTKVHTEGMEVSVRMIIRCAMSAILCTELKKIKFLWDIN